MRVYFVEQISLQNYMKLLILKMRESIQLKVHLWILDLQVLRISRFMLETDSLNFSTVLSNS